MVKLYRVCVCVESHSCQWPVEFMLQVGKQCLLHSQHKSIYYCIFQVGCPWLLEIGSVTPHKARYKLDTTHFQKPWATLKITVIALFSSSGYLILLLASFTCCFCCLNVVVVYCGPFLPCCCCYCSTVVVAMVLTEAVVVYVVANMIVVL